MQNVRQLTDAQMFNYSKSCKTNFGFLPNAFVTYKFKTAFIPRTYYSSMCMNCSESKIATNDRRPRDLLHSRCALKYCWICIIFLFLLSVFFSSENLKFHFFNRIDFHLFYFLTFSHIGWTMMMSVVKIHFHELFHFVFCLIL